MKKDVTVSIRLSKVEYANLKDAAKKEHRPVSGFLRFLLLTHIAGGK